jgi:hypothetical protein
MNEWVLTLIKMETHYMFSTVFLFSYYPLDVQDLAHSNFEANTCFIQSLLQK